ncbi:ABC transporter permease subunit [Mycobacterium sp. KBS0706]|uniref:ABC transporter permease subunit n=1 Tax=Mycobacterium sp. KBS0706 TaxID=2578109 RepID=UPI00110FA422|nr:ABC transporter permease subunit [Mycobacterium sp. KBS0706]TSD88090.1 ABC transporter permease subunit [Mycobacterium sp. KBS0706]
MTAVTASEAAEGSGPRVAAGPSILRRLGGRLGRSLVIAIPYVWLFLFFLIPFVIVLKIAFADKVIGQPPYTPLWDWIDEAHLGISLSVGNFQFLLDDPLYVSAYFSSVKIAAISTVLSLLVGYPMAYAIARSSQQWRVPLLMLVILPFWTSFLIRVYAWIGILQQQGLLNNLLIWLGIIDQPLEILHTDTAVYIGIVYSYLPFMILPLYATLEKLDVSLLEAAEDLGCRPWKAFLLITLPLSLPGIIAGSLLVFIPAVGEYVIPELLGGIDTLMIGKVLSNEFFQNTDWPVASAVAIVLLLVLVIPIMVFQYVQAKQQEAER